MGWFKKTFGSSASKAVKGATKAVTGTAKNFVTSLGKTTETAVSGTYKLAQGDISGALDKYGRTLTNYANVATSGTMDFTGRNGGIININSPKYFNLLTKGVKSSGSSGTTKGLVRSLRQGKTVFGGGSIVKVAKNPTGR